MQPTKCPHWTKAIPNPKLMESGKIFKVICELYKALIGGAGMVFDIFMFWRARSLIKGSLNT